MPFLRPSAASSTLTRRVVSPANTRLPLSVRDFSLTNYLGGEDSQGGSTQKPPEEASANSGGSRSKEAKETGSSPTGGSLPESAGGVNGSEGECEPKPAPKIHSQVVQDKITPAKQEDVDQHNREFEQRHDRAAPAEDDKVDKKYWKGMGGADREA